MNRSNKCTITNLITVILYIAIVVVLVVLLFGGKKIPELMKGLGGGIKEFKKASKEEETDKIEDKK